VSNLPFMNASLSNILRKPFFFLVNDILLRVDIYYILQKMILYCPVKFTCSITEMEKKIPVGYTILI
jgi:hypothetical protein